MPGPVVEMTDLRLGLQVGVRHSFLLHLGTDVSGDRVEILPVVVQGFKEQTLLISGP